MGKMKKDQPDDTSLQLYSDPKARKKPSVTSSEAVLAKELLLCSQNSKAEFPKELIDEFYRVFSEYPATERLIRAFRNHRDSSNFNPTIAEIQDQLRAIEQQERERRKEFIACRVDGCIDGWRPAGNGGYQRCQCLLNHIAVVKYGKDPTTLPPAPKGRSEADQRQDWNRFLFEQGLDPDMTPQQYYVATHREEIKRLAENMAMNNKPHPMAKQLLALRKKGITGKRAYKILNTSPSGRPYAEHWPDESVPRGTIVEGE